MNKNKEKKEKKVSANKSAEIIDIYQPPPFNKTTVKLFAIIGKIYLDNNLKKYYSVRRFKSYLSLYFGFKAENINLKFNFLDSVGIIKVQRRAKRGDAGGLELNVEKLLEYYDDQRVFNAWNSERMKEKFKLEEEAREHLKRLKGAEMVKKNAEKV